MTTKELAELVLARLERIEGKVDAAHRHMNNIDVTLASQSKDIEHHIKRTDLLEKRIDSVQPMAVGAKAIYWFLGACGAVLGAYVAYKRLGL